MANQGKVILVPIDLYGINRRNLETLVRIARQLDRGLLGLLLDDTRLRRVADLPFTTEITLGSGRERSLLRDHLTQRLSDVGVLDMTIDIDKEHVMPFALMRRPRLNACHVDIAIGQRLQEFLQRARILRIGR